ncbi:MAG: flavodoxin family protein [Planctomycetota bacterium]
MRIAVLYWSEGGNTQAVAQAIHETLRREELDAELIEIRPELHFPLYEYHLIFIGAPVYGYLPPEDVREFLGRMMRDQAEVLPATPERPGHYAVLFCTYGGAHTGVREAIPMLKYTGQFFEHAGVRVVDEWPVVGKYHGRMAAMNTGGRLGDVSGRPSEADLYEIAGRVRGLLARLSNLLPAGE